MTTSDPRTTWNAGYGLLLTAPFIGLLLTFTDPPQWLQITGALVIVLIVGVASSMIRRRPGGWRPSDDLKNAKGATGTDHHQPSLDDH